MKSVALNINDTQRQFDSLQEIVRLQSSINSDNWIGPDLLDLNTIILYRGELIKLNYKQNYNKKYKEIYLIILNNEVVICNKKVSSIGFLNVFQ